MIAWTRVSKSKPCPVCKHSDWCGVSADGILAICMRVESARPSRNGGWVHRLRDTPPAYRPPIKPPARPLTNCNALISQWRQATTELQLQSLADSIGVAHASLAELGAAWASSYSAWAFPMRDGAGQTIGIRLRSDAGKKWAVTGSREGLFYPERTPADHTAWICEGPTDAAAGLSIGLFAIGRPSCSGGTDALKALFRRLAIHRAIIVADYEEPKTLPSGSTWRPGAAGAARLSNSLPVFTKMIFTPAKDLREWVRSGATADLLRMAAEQFPWKRG